MASSSSNQILSQQQTVPIQTFQELPLEKDVYNAFQNLEHNSSLAQKLPALDKQAVRNVGKNLHKFDVDDQAMITNNGPYFKRQKEEWAFMRQKLENQGMKLEDQAMKLKDVEMQLKYQKMEISNMHTNCCQTEFLNVLRDLIHQNVGKSKWILDGMHSGTTRKIRGLRNTEVHSVTFEGCINACQSFMAEKDSPLEWKTMFEAFFEVSLDEAKKKLLPLDNEFPDFQIKAIMTAQAGLLFSCQMDQFPNFFQKWLKAVGEYLDLQQTDHPSSSSFPSSTNPELENDSALLYEARKHIQELAIECLKSEKDDRARAASNGMVTGFPMSKEVLKKRHDKWKEGGQWENIVKLSELYNAAAKGKIGTDKRD